jgi:hypothetical protein
MKTAIFNRLVWLLLFSFLSLSCFSQTSILYAPRCPTANFVYPQKTFSHLDTTIYEPLLLGMNSISGKWSISPKDTIGIFGQIRPSQLAVGQYTITHHVKTKDCDTPYSVTINIVAEKVVEVPTNSIGNIGSNASDRPPFTVQSPNVASLGLYGSVAVSHFTGKPSVPISLGSVGNENVNVPVSVMFDPSGVRPDSHSGVGSRHESKFTGRWCD